MNIKLFLSYINKCRKVIIMFTVCIVIFYVTFYLYQLPTESVFYATLLCVIFAAIWMIIDLIKYCKQHLILKDLKNHIIYNLDGIPAAKNLIEEDFIDLITILNEEKSRLIRQADHSYSELLDYYTLWVHQIKTPIAALKLLLQSNVHNINDLNDYDNHLNTIMQSELFKIEQYVEMVLQYLRTESMSADLLIKHYSLDSIMKQSVRKYASLFIQKKIRLTLADLNYEALTDEKWFSFIIEQILSNSLKYTPVGGEIFIYMDSLLPATLVIEDSGIGIRPEDLPRVFERGFSGYNGRTDKKSTGIGLYLSMRIIKKLSHTISIESEVGKGTKVKIGLDTVDISNE